MTDVAEAVAALEEWVDAGEMWERQWDLRRSYSGKYLVTLWLDGELAAAEVGDTLPAAVASALETAAFRAAEAPNA